MAVVPRVPGTPHPQLRPTSEKPSKETWRRRTRWVLVGCSCIDMEPVLVTTPPLQNVIAEMRNNLAEARGAKEGGKEAASTAEQGPGHSLCF